MALKRKNGMESVKDFKIDLCTMKVKFQGKLSNKKQ